MRMMILLMTVTLSFSRLLLANTITIGGLFNPFDSIGNIDSSQIEHLSAFVLAINEINANSSILNGITLDYVIRSVYDSNTAVIASNTFQSQSIFGVVGALTNIPTEIAHITFGKKNIAMIDSVATESSLLDSLVYYPYSIHINSVDSYEGLVIQSILCENNIKNIAVFVENTNKYMSMLDNLLDGHYCHIKPVSIYTLVSYQTDFSQEISKTMTSDLTYFILLMETSLATNFISQAYIASLFHSETQVIGCSDLLNNEIFSTMVNTNERDNAFKGFLSIQFYPLYHTETTSIGREYYLQFKSQSNTINNCSTIRDRTDYYYLYLNGNISHSTCVGLNYSIYDSVTMINPYTAYTYDATYALVYAIKKLLDETISINGSSITSTLINSVTFTGASGLIKFSSLTKNSHQQAYRSNGLTYSIYNYQSKINHSFVQSKLWTSENGMIPCTSNNMSSVCYPIEYNTYDNSLPNGYPPYAYVTTPTIIRIAAIFNLYNNNGKANTTDIEDMAAFIMAIREINNKHDNIFDDILPHSIVKYEIIVGTDFSSLVANTETFLKGYFGQGVLGVVNPLQDTPTALVINSLLQNKNVLQVTSVATDTNLGDSSQYPIDLQILPVDSYRGKVIQEMLCRHYKYLKIGIFAEDDSYGSQTTNSLIDGTYCTFDILSKELFSVDTFDFTEHIQAGLEGGATIFVFFMADRSAGFLLEQGYNAGLFGDGVQIFGTTRIMIPRLFTWFHDASIIPKVLKGFIGVAKWYDYSLSRTPQGKAFYSRWRKQNNTGPTITSYSKHKQCNQAMDDAAKTFLYRSQTNYSQCYGLNFTSYKASKPSVNQYASVTYDATITLLQGIHYAIKNNQSLNATSIQTAAISNVNFQGASGQVALYQGQSSISYGVGDRNVGLYCKIENFNEQAYLSTSGLSAFVQVLYWTSDDGLLPCTSDMGCYSPTYNSLNNDNTPASDTRPTIVITLSNSMRSMLFVFGGLVWFVVIGIGVFIFRYRNVKYMKASQIPMMYFMLLGEIFAGTRIFIAGLEITDQSCIAGLWTGHLAFFFVFGCLFLKTWRIHKLVNSSLKRVKITIYDILKMLFYVEVMVIVYLLLLTFVGKPHRSALSSTQSNQTTEDIRCGFHYSLFNTVLFAIEGVIVLVGARLCWVVKDVPDAVNESKFIAMAITLILMISTLAFPVVFLINLPPTSQQIVASVSFTIAALATMAVLFIPKILTVIESGGYIDGNLKVLRKISPADVISNTKVMTGAYIRSTVAMKKMNMDEKVELIKKQLIEWEALLMQHIDTDGKGSNLHSHSRSQDRSQHHSQQLPSEIGMFARRNSQVSDRNNCSMFTSEGVTIVPPRDPARSMHVSAREFDTIHESPQETTTNDV